MRRGFTVPPSLRAGAKARIRQVVRARGYDIVPLGAGLPAFQRRQLDAVGTVLDVGANVGQFAERVRDLGFRGTVHSFEPSAAAFAVLADRSAATPQWVAHRCALGADPAEAELHIAANSVSSSLLPIGRAHVEAAPSSSTVRTELVQVRRLDDVLSDAGAATPYYLKLDVQGFELEVLRGAPRTLERTLAVQTEVSFDDLYEGQADWLELCSFLAERGFSVGYLEPGFEAPRDGRLLQADLVLTRTPSR